MLCLFVASGGAFLCCTRFAWSVQEKLSRTVRMAGLMAYTLTEDTGVDLRDREAWTLVRTKDAKRQRVRITVLGVVARVFSLASGVASCLLGASYAFYAVCTFNSAALRGPCRVHGHRFKNATIELFVLLPTLTHPHGPLPSPCPRNVSCSCFV